MYIPTHDVHYFECIICLKSSDFSTNYIIHKTRSQIISSIFFYTIVSRLTCLSSMQIRCKIYSQFLNILGMQKKCKYAHLQMCPAEADWKEFGLLLVTVIKNFSPEISSHISYFLLI